jgi:Uma2 family endonuclease
MSQPQVSSTLDAQDQRWLQIVMDPSLADLPERIETDRDGNLIMSPTPDDIHADYAEVLRTLLHRYRSEGVIRGGRPIATSEGTKVADLVWMTKRQAKEREALKDPNLPYRPAPRICIDIASPSNTVQELDSKRALYLAAGAHEVWIVDRNGRIDFFSNAGKIQRSEICPQIPNRIPRDVHQLPAHQRAFQFLGNKPRLPEGPERPERPKP